MSLGQAKHELKRMRHGVRQPHSICVDWREPRSPEWNEPLKPGFQRIDDLEDEYVDQLEDEHLDEGNRP